MILLDTDVLIDVALDRRPHSEHASELLDRIELGLETASIAWHPIANLYYIVRPTRGHITTREFIRDLIGFVQVAQTDTKSILYAIQLEMADLEDSMQVAAAQVCDADYIVTRNIKDYQHSPIPAITPQQFHQNI